MHAQCARHQFGCIDRQFHANYDQKQRDECNCTCLLKLAVQICQSSFSRSQTLAKLGLRSRPCISELRIFAFQQCVRSSLSFGRTRSGQGHLLPSESVFVVDSLTVLTHLADIEVPGYLKCARLCMSNHVSGALTLPDAVLTFTHKQDPYARSTMQETRKGAHASA